MFYKSNQFKVNIIWTLFFVSLFTIGIHLANRLLNLGLNQVFTENLMLFFPAVLLVLHSTSTLGVNKAFGFICLAALVGLIMEILGLKTGVIFGGNYVYKQSSFMLFNVPLVFFDGLFTVLIDLIMDPIQVYAGTWTWLSKGLYFNIPTGNFVGWFLVTIIVTGIFRTTEYYFPNQPKFDKSIMLIPVIGYAAISISLATSAMNIGYFSLAIISILTLLPISLMNISLFFRRNSP